MFSISSLSPLLLIDTQLCIIYNLLYYKSLAQIVVIENLEFKDTGNKGMEHNVAIINLNQPNCIYGITAILIHRSNCIPDKH